MALTKCPVDQSEMRQIQDKGIALDWCDLCDGIWLDPGELARLSRTTVDIPNLLPKPAPARTHESSKTPQCPRCNVPLEEILYEQAGSLQVDRCPGCHGLWLERGELQEIYDAAGRKLRMSGSGEPAAPADNSSDSLGTTVLITVLILLAGLIAILVIWIFQRPL